VGHGGGDGVVGAVAGLEIADHGDGGEGHGTSWPRWYLRGQRVCGRDGAADLAGFARNENTF